MKKLRLGVEWREEEEAKGEEVAAREGEEEGTVNLSKRRWRASAVLELGLGRDEEEEEGGKEEEEGKEEALEGGGGEVGREEVKEEVLVLMVVPEFPELSESVLLFSDLDVLFPCPLFPELMIVCFVGSNSSWRITIVLHPKHHICFWRSRNKGW